MAFYQFFIINFSNLKLKAQKSSTFHSPMIQNPELAQSFILVSVLRQQRDRLLAKSSSIPTLNAEIIKMTQQLNEKSVRRKQEEERRRIALMEFRAELQEKMGRKREIGMYAEEKMRELRGNLAKMRKTKIQITQLRRQSQLLSTQQQNDKQQAQFVAQALKQQKKQLHKLQQTRRELSQQLAIGKHRIRQQFQLYTQIRNETTQALSQSLKIQQQIFNLTAQIKQLEHRGQAMTKQIYNTKMEIYSQQQQLQSATISTENTAKYLSQHTKTHASTLEATESLSQQIIALQAQLQTNFQACEEKNSETVVLGAKASSLERDNKLIGHRIECIQMLVKRLYGSRDRLIVLRRNNASRGRAHGGEESGRASQVRGTGFDRENFKSEVSLYLKSQNHLKEPIQRDQ